MSDMNGNEKAKVLVTGVAGFIGFHFTQKIMKQGYRVVGVDNLNAYYGVDLKLDRLKALGFSQRQLEEITGRSALELDDKGTCAFYPRDLKDRQAVREIFATEKPDYVVHLAAQAGVRYSITNPYEYIDSNIMGFMNILEACRDNPVKHLTYASSSSVYGANEEIPFSVHHTVDHPVSLYAATKKSNELMAHTYSHLFKIPTTGLRFFTVYGPWGRPDMAYFSFTRKILRGEPIQVFNNGDMRRDFTYIDDIVEGVSRVMLKVPEGNPQWDGRNPDPATSKAPYRVFNIGNNQPVGLLDFIGFIEKHLRVEAKKELMPMQQGDVKETYADTQALQDYVGFEPSTPLDTGISRFIDWYLDYFKISRPGDAAQA